MKNSILFGIDLLKLGSSGLELKCKGWKRDWEGVGSAINSGKCLSLGLWEKLFYCDIKARISILYQCKRVFLKQWALYPCISRIGGNTAYIDTVGWLKVTGDGSNDGCFMFNAQGSIAIKGVCPGPFLKFKACLESRGSRVRSPLWPSSFKKIKIFLPRSVVTIQYCGEPPWLRGSVLGLRPPGREFQILCLGGRFMGLYP